MQELNRAYQALLLMYGEKQEEVNELRMDVADVKQMYREQIQELMGRSTAGIRGASTGPGIGIGSGVNATSAPGASGASGASIASGALGAASNGSGVSAGVGGATGSLTLRHTSQSRADREHKNILPSVTALGQDAPPLS